MNPGDSLFTQFISLPSSRILTAVSGPMTKNDFNIHLANYAIIVYELNYTTNSIQSIQQVKFSFPIHSYAISSLQDSLQSPALSISTDKRFSNFIMLSTSCSGYVMILSLTSTGGLLDLYTIKDQSINHTYLGLSIAHGSYIDIKYPVLSAVAFALPTMELSSVTSQLEISCFQFTKQKPETPFAIQQYQVPIRSVVCEKALEDRPEVSISEEAMEETSYPPSQPVSEPKARTIMSILSNSATKTSVLSAFFPVKETSPSPVKPLAVPEAVALSVMAEDASPSSPVPANQTPPTIHSPIPTNSSSTMLLNILTSKTRPMVQETPVEVAPSLPLHETDSPTPMTPSLEVLSMDTKVNVTDSTAPREIASNNELLCQRIEKLEALVQQLISSTTSEKTREGLRKNELKEINEAMHKAVEDSMKDAVQSKLFADQVIPPCVDYILLP